MKRYIAIFTCWFPLLPAIGLAADGTSRCVRLAIVDDSGSMGSGRVETVKNELLKVARQLPPTPECPFGLITFGSTAKSVRWFTELVGFERAVRQLAGASGGTNIASGLEEAARALKPQFQSTHMCILLYTDGEDGNQEGILRAETQLDAMFSQRQRVGLSQTVFCKRWGNSNGALIEQLRRHNRANIVDAGELSIIPLTFTPKIMVRTVRWESLSSNRLAVTFAANVTVQGISEALTPVSLKCLNPRATGHVETRVVPNSSQSVERTIVVPVSDAEFQAERLTLRFFTSLPTGQKTDQGIVLPSMDGDRLDVAVRLPMRIHHRELNAVMTSRGFPTWHDPLDRIMACPVKLTASFKTDAKDDHGRSSRFRIVPDRDCRIVSGPEEFELTANRSEVIPLTLATRSPASTQIGLSVVPVSDQQRNTYKPPRVHTILTGLKAPPAVTSTISACVKAASTPQWVDLAQCTARLVADVEFEVNGPITDGARFTLIAPAQITAFEFTPPTLHSGKQIVRFLVDARLTPGPEQTTLKFRIVPPTPVGGVRFAAPTPFGLCVTGPAAVSLALAGVPPGARPMRTAIADNDETAILRLTPAISGVSAEAVASIAANVSASGTELSTANSSTLPLYSSADTHIHVAPPTERSFFRDVILHGQVELQANPPTPAVHATQYPLEIVQQAPFKRLAFLLAVSLSILLTVIMLLRMYFNLRKTEV